MHVRTSKLAKFFRGCIRVPRFNREGASEKGERAGSERRRGEGIGRRHDGRKGRKEGMGIQMRGISPLLLGGIDATDDDDDDDDDDDIYLTLLVAFYNIERI